MRVKTKTLQAGPQGVIPADTVIDVPDDIGMELVSNGFADPVERAPIEVAARRPAEHAVRPKPTWRAMQRGKNKWWVVDRDGMPVHAEAMVKEEAIALAQRGPDAAPVLAPIANPNDPADPADPADPTEPVA